MMQSVLLGDICSYVTEKVAVDKIALNDYVSTENLLPDKGGLSLATNLPRVGKVTRYKKGDVLVSNIRPYFKKIWHANRDGGASNDVLVLRPKDDSILHNYLYYVLKNDSFFDFSTKSSSGSKMPRGDKVQIMKYQVYLPHIDTQKKIAAILGALDKKIELNRKMNETLEQIGQALFRHYFIDNPDAEKWEMMKLSDFSSYISRGLSPKYSDNGESLVVNQRCIRGGRLSLENARRQSKSIPEEKLLKKGDVLINSTGVGTLGRVAQVDETLPNVTFDSHVTVVRPSVDIHFFGQLLRNLEPKLELMGRGTTGQTELSRLAVGDIKVSLPPDKIMDEFGSELAPVRKQMHANDQQVQILTALRDTLLPRLLSRRLEVK